MFHICPAAPRDIETATDYHEEGGKESYQIISYRTSRAGGRRVTKDTESVSPYTNHCCLWWGHVRGTMSINTPQ